MSDQRTEDPTPRRRDEARRKGESVGRSHELALATTLSVAVLALPAMLPGIVASLATLLRSSLNGIGDGRVSNGRLLTSTGNGLGQGLALVLPLVSALVVAGVLANLVAGGLVLSPAAIRLNLGRLNPLTGLRRIADRQALVRLGLALVKMILLLLIGWSVLGGYAPRILALTGSDVPETLGVAMSAARDLGIFIAIFGAGVALADFIVQRRRAHGQLRMTKDAVRREARESDGDPMIRAQRRRRAREFAFSRMLAAVETADVVVVNPIHLAVALKYDSLTMKAPRIVAKGQRLMAGRIREAAIKHGVPIVQDVPLARALFGRPIGAEVPPQLYKAVARILIVVHRARFGRRSEATRAAS
jgi:flagellar biosynthetic protein FlhB